MMPIPHTARALAEGDFTQIAAAFAGAGFSVRQPAGGILHIAADRAPGRPRLLLSVGIHGDETAPIGMLAHLLNALAATPAALALDLMVVVGNLAAIAQGTRFVDIDMNRLFRVGGCDWQASVEAKRAKTIMQAAAAFLDAGDAGKWHLDLHSAIRPSHYPAFAVVPDAAGDSRMQTLLGWLGAAGIGAAIRNEKPAATFSAWSAGMCGAASATVELGRVAQLGASDLDRFAATRAALDGFLRSGRMPEGAPPHRFRVAQELVKHSEAFRLSFGRDTQNFTPMQPGTVLAEDGDIIYRVGAATEYVVFPNQDVQPGLRAGLMVVRED